MTLIKFKNSNPNQISNLPSFIGDFFNDFMNTELATRDVFKSMPAVNISETNDAYLLELASPGMRKEDFRIEVENGVMTISSERKMEDKTEDSRFTRREFSYSTFSRTFTLPEHVAMDGISAQYEQGILMITIPKKDEAKKKPVREITVS